jgi:two-component system sensor histidine kinase KdpD
MRRVAEQQPHRVSMVRVGQQPVTDTFLPFRSADGEAGVIRIFGPLTTPRGGDVDALLRAFADEAGVAIHRARLADQAREADALRRSDEFKSVLLSSVSHDLRSPLTAIKAAVGSMRTQGLEWSDTDRAQLLEAIESQTDRLTHTVGDLLEMSRLEGGAITPALEAVAIRVVFQDATLATRTATESRAVCAEAPEETWARADYGLLLQALTNLIENAAKYSIPGGAIRLRATAGGGRVLIDVTDEGPGIALDDLPHIFERFYRGGVARNVAGSGLGLAIARAMIELCGGRLSVESSPAGSTFRITLRASGPPK